MSEILISSLLPIVVTLFLGYFAGLRHDFTAQHASLLNNLVMTYTLPLSLFGGILATRRQVIFAHLAVAWWIFLGMVGGYLIVLFVAHYVFKNSLPLAALRALAIAGPAIPFVGPTILGSLFPHESALLIAIGGLIMNVVQVPLTVVLLTSSADHGRVSATQHVLSAFKKPVVWAPILAFVLALLGVYLPAAWQKNLRF